MQSQAPFSREPKSRELKPRELKPREPKSEEPTFFAPARFSRSAFRRRFRRQALTPKTAIPCSRWCHSSAKRLFDALLAFLILVVFSPLLILIGIVVRCTSPGPAIFRQKRVGRHGEEFTILKFRTMQHAVEGSARSSHTDHRLTRPGRLLRKYKLDELPQLLNVVQGDMSLVGPRPRLNGHHTGHHNGLHSPDTCFRPGLTGAATLAFASEEHLLREIPPEFLEECHARLISPRKLELDLEYMAHATLRSDIHLMWKTLLRRDRYTDLDQLGEWQPPHHLQPAYHAHPLHTADSLKGSGLSSATQTRGIESLSI